MSKAQWGHGFHTGQESVRRSDNFPIGYFVHLFNGDPPQLQFQGEIVGKIGEMYSVQLFDFLWGDPSTIKNFSENIIQSGLLYADADEWRDAADAMLEKQRRLDNSKLDALLKESKPK